MRYPDHRHLADDRSSFGGHVKPWIDGLDEVGRGQREEACPERDEPVSMR